MGFTHQGRKARRLYPTVPRHMNEVVLRIGLHRTHTHHHRPCSSNRTRPPQVTPQLVQQLLPDEEKAWLPRLDTLRVAGPTAFAEDDHFRLLVSQHVQASNETVLMVKGNGNGLPDTVDINSDNTLGLKIARVLAEGQLDGTLKVTRGAGAGFSVTFPLDH